MAPRGLSQERFWETLYPEVVDDDLEYRTAPLRWRNQKLLLCVPPSSPVTQSLHGEQYTWRDWNTSRTVDNLGRRSPEAKQAALADGKIGGEQFDKAVETTPLAYYRQLSEDIQDCRAACAQLVQEVDARCGADGPWPRHQHGAGGLPQPGRRHPAAAWRARAGRDHGRAGALQGVPEPRLPQQRPWRERRWLAASSAPESEAPTALPLEPSRSPGTAPGAAATAGRPGGVLPPPRTAQSGVLHGDMPLDVWLQYVIHDEAVLDRVHETLGLHDVASSTTDA